MFLLLIDNTSFTDFFKTPNNKRCFRDPVPCLVKWTWIELDHEREGLEEWDASLLVW